MVARRVWKGAQFWVVWGGSRMARPRFFATVLLAVSISGLSLRGLGELNAQVPDTLPPRELARPVKQPVVTAVAIHPRGTLVAAAGDDHRIRVYDAKTLTIRSQLAGHSDWIKSVAFSADGSRLLSAGNDGRVAVWDVERGKQVRSLRHAVAIADVAFHPDGKSFAVVGFSAEMLIYTLADEAADVVRVPCPCADMRTIAYSLDGKFLAGGGRNGTIRIWSTTSYEQVRDTAAHRGRVRDLAFVDGAIVSVSEDRSLHVLPLQDASQAYRLKAPTKLMAVASYGPQRVVTGGSDNRLRFWDLTRRVAIGSTDNHDGTIAALACHKESVASGSYDTRIRVIDARAVEQALRNQQPVNVSKRD